MRGTDASALVLSAFAALARARELQIDDVPVECATICGPIVELTFKCDVDNTFDELKRLKRRRIDASPPVERRQAMRAPAAQHHRVRREHHHHTKNREADIEAPASTPALDGQAAPTDNADAQPAQDAQPPQDAQPAQDASPIFIATLPSAAPALDTQLSTTTTTQTTTSSAAPPPPPPPPPPQATPSVETTPQAKPTPPVNVQPTSTSTLTVPAPTMPSPQAPPPPSSVPAPPPVMAPPPVPAPPAISAPPSVPAPPAVPAPSVVSAPPVLAPLSPPPSQATTSMPAAMPIGGDAKRPEQQLQENRENAERDCTCLNKSFDVQLVAGLCQSCIRQSGNQANDMDFIMGQCNFVPASYTRDKDRLIDNIRVVAEKPFLNQSGNVMADAGRVGAGCGAAAAVVVSLVAGMALLL